MNTRYTRSIVCGLIVASLGVGTISHAQPSRHEARRDARDARQDMREAQRDLRRADNPREAREARRDMRDARRDMRDAREERRDARTYYNAHDFRRGGRLPPELRDRQYVVNDWRGHHLKAPPRGYQWVQVGPDYVLVAIATGVIASLILNQ